MKTKLSLLLITICVLISCKKNEEIEKKDVIVPDSAYASLTIHFIYETNTTTQVFHSFGYDVDSTHVANGTSQIHKPLSIDTQTWYSYTNGTADTSITWNSIPISANANENKFWYKYEGQQQSLFGWTTRKIVKKFTYTNGQKTLIQDTIKYF